MSATPKMSFGKWFGIFVLAWLVFDFALVGSAALFLNLALEKLTRPFTLVLGCGVLSAALTYWARESRRPKSPALRLALAAGLCFEVFQLAMAISAVEVGLMLTWINYIPIISVGAILGGISTYAAARRKQARYRNHSQVPNL